ncbi:MAG: ribosome silencing factor [Robiginitomaculum sp.]|nr:MAG: ribosome silencing factor [Robiginitomaculum sp.]
MPPLSTETANQSLEDNTPDPQPGHGKFSSAQLQALIVSTLDADKAEDIVCIDLHEKSSVTDIMIIASGRSQRHVGALADHILRTLKEQGLGRVEVEGLPSCDWVLVDAGDVILHLFRPEVRGFYNLEKMWSATVADPEDDT